VGYYLMFHGSCVCWEQWPGTIGKTMEF